MVKSGATTASEAVAMLPIPPFAELTSLVVLSFVPPDVPVTFTAKVQELLAATVAPERITTLVV
jgi:hypothetical protein